MGAWGPKLYQDDIAEEVRDYYKDQLHRGKTEEQVTDELIDQNEDYWSDQDDAPVFWFALADTQWNLGRLEERVKEKALYYIDLGTDVQRWRAENPKFAVTRERVINDLKKRLLSEQPPKKKISQYRLYKCEWQIGDVFAYKLTSEIAIERGYGGKYVYFVKVGECTWWPGHIVPQVYFFNVVSNDLLRIDDVKSFGIAHQFYYPAVYEKNPSAKGNYLLTFISTSKRVIPMKNLIYLGNALIDRILDEDKTSFKVFWKEFERYITNIFMQWGVGINNK